MLMREHLSAQDGCGKPGGGCVYPSTDGRAVDINADWH